MSAEDTELTFIRCPSCRSLVPAVATRCRMCGHQFSSQEASDTSKNRIKQVEETSERNVLYSEPEEKSAASFEPEFDDLVEDYSDEGEDEESDDDFSPQTGNANGLEQGAGKRKRRRRRKKKNPEQGFSNDSARFEAPRAEMPRAETPRVESPRVETQRTEAPRYEAPRAETPRVETPRVETPRYEAPRAETPKVETPRVEQRHEAPRSFEPRTEQIKTPKEANMQNGLLVGWLVNYAQNSNGSSIELRSGKYFVARQKLRDDDLVIPDSAISTPHCLIKASKGQLQIQDLMSEQGTFVKKSGSSSFQPVEEVGTVEHGDRIRFGAFEVVVCLIP